jgi:hypothetical protein
MAAPANDLFVNARYIYDGIQFGDDLTGATLEAGESTSTWGTGVTIDTRSIWYKWVAAATVSVTVKLAVASSQKLTVFASSGEQTVDTLDTITPLAHSALIYTFVATAGLTYYFRVSNSSGTNTFQLSYPVGRAPGALRSQGTNDLPTNINALIRSNARVKLTEAVGYGPDSERMTSRFDLLVQDEHSESPFAANHLLRRSSDNSPSYSCERWVRLRFEPPFAAITKLRFWVNNYSANSGWALYYGLASTFRKPSDSASDIAVRPVPTADPDVANLGPEILTGGQVQYSQWLVFQAVWIGGNPGKLQTSDLNWEFDWTEM